MQGQQGGLRLLKNGHLRVDLIVDPNFGRLGVVTRSLVQVLGGREGSHPWVDLTMFVILINLWLVDACVITKRVFVNACEELVGEF